jgi:hypothetical protein
MFFAGRLCARAYSRREKEKMRWGLLTVSPDDSTDRWLWRHWKPRRLNTVSHSWQMEIVLTWRSFVCGTDSMHSSARRANINFIPRRSPGSGDDAQGESACNYVSQHTKHCFGAVSLLVFRNHDVKRQPCSFSDVRVASLWSLAWSTCYCMSSWCDQTTISVASALCNHDVV